MKTSPLSGLRRAKADMQILQSVSVVPLWSGLHLPCAWATVGSQQRKPTGALVALHLGTSAPLRHTEHAVSVQGPMANAVPVRSLMAGELALVIVTVQQPLAGLIVAGGLTGLPAVYRAEPGECVVSRADVQR